MAETTTISRPAPYLEAAGQTYLDLLTKKVGQAPTAQELTAMSQQIAGQGQFTQAAQQAAARQAGLGALTFDPTTGGTYLGIGVVLSEFQRNNLNTAGVFDNLTTDNTMHMIVNRQAWGLGTFRNVGVETSRFAGYDQLALLGTWSGDMKKLVLAAELSEVGIVDVPTT